MLMPQTVRLAAACCTVLLRLRHEEASASDRFRSCGGVAAEVAADLAEDRRRACLGAGDAVAFFRSPGLKIAAPIRTKVASDLPPPN